MLTPQQSIQSIICKTNVYFAEWYEFVRVQGTGLHLTPQFLIQFRGVCIYVVGVQKIASMECMIIIVFDKLTRLLDMNVVLQDMYAQ